MGKARKRPEVSSSYDAAADVLYVTFGDPRPGVGREPEDDIIVRVDPDDESILGLTILNWQSRFHKNPEAVARALRGQVPEAALQLISA